MDIAGLSKLTADTIILVLSALGFMVRLLQCIATIKTEMKNAYILPLDFRVCYRGVPDHTGEALSISSGGK